MNALNDVKSCDIKILRIKDIFQTDNANENASVTLFLLTRFY